MTVSAQLAMPMLEPIYEFTGEHRFLSNFWACLRAKFAMWTNQEQDPTLGLLLVGTSPRVLIEGNTWGDAYWGVLDRGRGRGKNLLGRLLMLRRAELLVAAAAGIDPDWLRHDR